MTEISFNFLIALFLHILVGGLLLIFASSTESTLLAFVSVSTQVLCQVCIIFLQVYGVFSRIAKRCGIEFTQ